MSVLLEVWRLLRCDQVTNGNTPPPLPIAEQDVHPFSCRDSLQRCHCIGLTASSDMRRHDRSSLSHDVHAYISSGGFGDKCRVTTCSRLDFLYGSYE